MSKIDCFLVDIDGPVTGAFADVKKVAVRPLIKKANEGHKVFFVSGRSIDWIEKNLLPVINSFAPKFPNALNNIKFVGEHGLVTARIFKGKIIEKINRKISVPKKLGKRIKNLIDLIPGVFFDSTKQTIVTIESEHEIKKRNPALVEKGLQKAERIMREIASESRGFYAVRSFHSIDFLPVRVSKAFAAGQALKILGAQKKNVRHYFLFGDSPSDLRMIEPLRKRKLNYEFYFVGDKSKINLKKIKEIKKFVFPKRKFFRGTIEVFKKFKKRKFL